MSVTVRLQRIDALLTTILGVLDTMSTTAAQAQADLNASIANLTTVATSAVALLNELAASLKAGVALDPAAVEAEVALINAQAASLSAAVTADTPASTASAKPAA